MLPAPSSAERFHFVDALRGIGALFVFQSHLSGVVAPAAHDRLMSFFNDGQFGVAVFFICSGFVIPPAIERARSVGTFWVQRFFRLYPLYWASLAGACLLVWVGLIQPPDRFLAAPVETIAVHLTMLQSFFGEDLLPVYWTLGYEMIFYVLVTVLFISGLLRRPIAISLVAIGTTAVAGIAPMLLLGRPGPVGAAANLTAMLAGYLFCQHAQGRIPTRMLVTLVGLEIAVICTAFVVNFTNRPEPITAPVHALPMVSAWLLAFGSFGGWYALRRLTVPRWLVELGTISYSLYLLHPLIMALLPPGMEFAAIVAVPVVSAMAYRWIELPAMRLGKRLTARPMAVSHAVETRPMPLAVETRPVPLAVETRPLAVEQSRVS